RRHARPRLRHRPDAGAGADPAGLAAPPPTQQRALHLHHRVPRPRGEPQEHPGLGRPRAGRRVGDHAEPEDERGGAVELPRRVGLRPPPGPGRRPLGRRRRGRGAGVRDAALPERARPRLRRARLDEHVRPARHRRRAAGVGERGVPRRRGAGAGPVRHRGPEREHPGRAAGDGGGPVRRAARDDGGGAGLPPLPLQPHRAADRGEALLPPRLPAARRPRGPRPLPRGGADHDRRGVRRLAGGAAGALRRRRRLRPDLPARRLTMPSLALPARGTARRPRVLPGFGLTLGFAVTYIGLLLVLPLTALALEASALTLPEWRALVTDPRLLGALRLSFGAAFVAASVNAVFGLLVAWVLVRYPFPGRRVVDAVVDLPFALPTAVAGIALTTLLAPNGWVGRVLVPLGVQAVFSPLGIVIALVFIGLPFVVRTVQPVLEDLEKDVEEAAASLGATRWQTFRRVLLPALVPPLLTGFTLAFARAL